jgi:hypothetical protein
MAALRQTVGLDGACVVDVVLTEHEAYHKARVSFIVERYGGGTNNETPLVTTEVFGEGNDGSLYIAVWDHAGNDDGWEDTYGEFFSDDMMTDIAELSRNEDS